MKTGTKIALGVGAVAAVAGIVYLLNNKFEFFKPQEDAHAKDVDNKANETITITTMKDEDVIKMVTSINDDFTSAIEEICATVPTVNPSGYMVSIVQTCKTKAEAEFVLSYDRFQNDYDSWLSSTRDMTMKCAEEASNLLLAWAQAPKQTKCIQTTFVDNVTETSEATTVVTNTAKKAFLGVCKKSSTEKTTVERNTVSHCMVPHCTNEAIDPAALAAGNCAVTLAVKNAYVPYKTALQSEPDISDYLAYYNAFVAK